MKKQRGGRQAERTIILIAYSILYILYYLDNIICTAYYTQREAARVWLERWPLTPPVSMVGPANWRTSAQLDLEPPDGWAFLKNHEPHSRSETAGAKDQDDEAKPRA